MLSLVVRQGGPALKQLAMTALDGSPDQLHAALDDDTRNHSTPFHDAAQADAKALAAKLTELGGRAGEWQKSLDGLTNPGMTEPAFFWAPGYSGDTRPSLMDVSGLPTWLAHRSVDLEDSAVQNQSAKPDPASVKAVLDLGGSLYAQAPDPKSPTYQRDSQEFTAWQQQDVVRSAKADDLRIFLESGGFPRTAPQPGTAEFRVAVENLKARFASCASTNPDWLDPHKVLGTEDQTAATEWQSEIASQQAQRDVILAQNVKATNALEAGAQALGEGLGQSWLADNLSKWQAYFSPGGKGTQGTGPIVFHLRTADGNCLDVAHSASANGTAVQAWGCNSTLAQEWRPTLTGALVNPATNKCLDVDGNHGPQHAGTAVQIYDCNGSGSQQWQFSTTNGNTRLYNVGSKLCLDVHTPNWGQGAQVWDCNGTGPQQFDARQDNTSTGDGDHALNFPKPAEFDRVKNTLQSVQNAAKTQWQLTQQQAAVAQQAAEETTKAQQQAYAIADAAGEPRGRGLLAGQQEAQATLASAAALAAAAKAAETTYNATLASGSDAQALQQLALTQAHSAQAAFRSAAAQAAADQAKASADGAAQQATKAAQAAKDAQGDLTTAQGAETSAKQAADTAKAKRAAAEASQATAADAKNKAAAAQTKTATDQATAESKADAATKASAAATAAGQTADQKKTAAQQADKAAQDSRAKAWEAEQAHNALQAKADAADAYASAQASGSDAQGAKDAATAADKDATDAQTNADQAHKAADAASADAQTADAEATRAEGAAAQAKSDASAAEAAKATADAAVRTDQSAVADARAAAERASTDAATAQKDAATAQTQADTARNNAIQAWSQAGQAQTTSASAAGFAYATAQAATAASTSAKQVAQPANDAIQLGAPYQDSDSSAGLAVLTGQASKTIADQQQATAQAKVAQAQQAADQAASLAAATSGDAQAADLASAHAAASAAAALASAKDALASSAAAAQALADAQASQARTIQYDSQAAGDAAAAGSAAQGAVGDATDARTSAVTAADDADKAKVAASDAQTAATTAREVANQAAKDATAAAAAAQDAQTQAAAAQQSAVNAAQLAAADQDAAARTEAEKEALGQQGTITAGGPTNTPNVFTTSRLEQTDDPTPNNTCVLGLGDSGCTVTFTVHYRLNVDYYLCNAQDSSDITTTGCPTDQTVWLGPNSTVLTHQFTHHFSNWDIVSMADKAVLTGLVEAAKKDLTGVLDKEKQDFTDCSNGNVGSCWRAANWAAAQDFVVSGVKQDFVDCYHGSVTGCIWAASWLVPPAKVAEGIRLILAFDDALRTGAGIADALKAIKLGSVDAKAVSMMEKEAQAAEDALGSCLRNSFPAGTQVLLADGSRKAIETIRPGDQVLATDPTGRTTRIEPVVDAFHHDTNRLVTIGLATGGQFSTTTGHRVYVPQRGWTFAADLHQGDLIQSSDGSTHTVTLVRDQGGLTSTTVYDLTVGDLHTFYVLAGNTPVLVHNAICPVQIGYASDEMSLEAFNYRVTSGYWDAEHNVAVARVRGADGTERFVYGNSGSPDGHAEQDIVNQLKSDDKVLSLYTDRAPCPDICSPLLSTDPRTKTAIISYVIPYASPTTADGRFLNKVWADHLAELIRAAKAARGIK
ncbi:RICIN domain-containing protein [Kitasatospora acidiphila]|uniref:RICIN domain-containing protein n=1 Tax=Kitasatospora acidiphila TaxID=2567942 RepID=UPI003C711469